MSSDDDTLYHAFASGDPRFDGVFFVGVTSTGIYCRPVCTARTPRAANCRFFSTAAAAEKARFRPCLRCRPELAPGNAPVDQGARIAARIAQSVEVGLEDDTGIEQLARQVGLSSRQVRRIVQAEFGVSPMEMVLTRRLLLAKQLLTETRLPVIEIAFASGFSSLRRFNDAFSARYGMPPTRLRKTAGAPAPGDDTLTLQIGYRPPFDWEGLLQFLAARAAKGVELVYDGRYLRTVRLGECTGWVGVTCPSGRDTLRVELSHSLTPVVSGVLRRLRQVFDTDARPELIAARLAEDPLLAASVRQNPGLRVPGAFDGFELAVRAILGQQVTVKAATTLGSRYVEALGEAVATPHAGLNRLTPTPQRVAAATVDDLGSLGIISSRARSILALAREITSDRLRLEPGQDPEATMEQLQSLPGIGPWTAHYIAMRALRWPDAFPKEDLALRKALGGVSAARAEELSQPWRPWRSYAVLHLWRGGPQPLTGPGNAMGSDS